MQAEKTDEQSDKREVTKKCEKNVNKEEGKYTLKHTRVQIYNKDDYYRHKNVTAEHSCVEKYIVCIEHNKFFQCNTFNFEERIIFFLVVVKSVYLQNMLVEKINFWGRNRLNAISKNWCEFNNFDEIEDRELFIPLDSHEYDVAYTFVDSRKLINEAVLLLYFQSFTIIPHSLHNQVQ